MSGSNKLELGQIFHNILDSSISISIDGKNDDDWYVVGNRD